MPTGRQGNLIVTSSKTVSDAELREMLKAEAKKQGKAYGLYFEDISSGFAVTTRRSPQAFQVIPLVVLPRLRRRSPRRARSRRQHRRHSASRAQPHPRH